MVAHLTEQQAAALGIRGSAPRKYGNVKIVIDGQQFDSQSEARHYGTLKYRERAGEIRDLRCQPSYDLIVNGIKVCRYIADFAYLEVATGKTICADVKGVRTSTYQLKKKLMKVCLGISILEVKA